MLCGGWGKSGTWDAYMSGAPRDVGRKTTATCRTGDVKRAPPRGSRTHRGGALPWADRERAYGKVSFQLLMYPVSRAALSWTRSCQTPLAASEEAFTV
ncbi:hypothetical protein GCM10010244_77020 [Streptomyces coeruleorubidus]|nr:hypothetical protein GCM10010244_77020 [Streptomyces bellus]